MVTPCFFAAPSRSSRLQQVSPLSRANLPLVGGHVEQHAASDNAPFGDRQDRRLLHAADASRRQDIRSKADRRTRRDPARRTCVEPWRNIVIWSSAYSNAARKRLLLGRLVSSPLKSLTCCATLRLGPAGKDRVAGRACRSISPQVITLPCRIARAPRSTSALGQEIERPELIVRAPPAPVLRRSGQKLRSFACLLAGSTAPLQPWAFVPPVSTLFVGV